MNTFQPRISANSRRSAAVTRSGAATPARLYDEEKQRQLERDTKRGPILRATRTSTSATRSSRRWRGLGSTDAIRQELVTSRVDGV